MIEETRGKQPGTAAVSHPDLEQFLDSMVQESDRAAVIVGVAQLDAELERLLTKHFLPSPESRDPLFEPERPLGSFAAKIDLAYRLGLISTELTRALHLLRRLRNDFAHDPCSASLADPKAANRVREIIEPLQQAPGWARIPPMPRTESLPPGTCRDFRMAIGILAILLRAWGQGVTRVDAARAVPLVPPSLKKTGG